MSDFYDDVTWGFINKNGKEIVSPQYMDVMDFSEGLAWVKIDQSNYTLVDETGIETLTCTYMDARSFSEGFAKVSFEGYIDKAGNTVFPWWQTRYIGEESVFDGDFSEGLAEVTQKDGKHGFINKAGEEVIPCKYDDASKFFMGYATVEQDGKWGMIDTKGVEVVPCKYDQIGDQDKATIIDGFVKVKSDGKWGLLAAKQSVAAPAPIMADPTNDTLKVDGVSQVPAAYKIGGANYFQLRDVAMLLNGTKGQFSVDYDGVNKAVKLTTGEAYQPLGTELAGAPTESQEAIVGNDAIYINGEKADLAVYKIGGANYFKIRDLGKALSFNVGWTAEKGMFIESDKPYTDAD